MPQRQKRRITEYRMETTVAEGTDKSKGGDRRVVTPNKAMQLYAHSDVTLPLIAIRNLEKPSIPARYHFGPRESVDIRFRT